MRWVLVCAVLVSSLGGLVGGLLMGQAYDGWKFYHVVVRDPNDPSRNVDLTALKMTRERNFYRLTGDVVLRTEAMELHADEIDVHEHAGALSEVRGNVRVKLLTRSGWGAIGESSAFH